MIRCVDIGPGSSDLGNLINEESKGNIIRTSASCHDEYAHISTNVSINVADDYRAL